jgi:hypothetical protein
MLLRIVGCACAAALLAGGSAARVDQAGLRAKQTVRAIAVLGPRVAGSTNELRAARVVRARFARLGLSPVVQRVRLPRGGASRNLVFRSGGGPLRAIVSRTSTASPQARRPTTTARESARSSRLPASWGRPPASSTRRSAPRNRS